MKRMLVIMLTIIFASSLRGNVLAEAKDNIDVFDSAYMVEQGLCDSNGRLYFQAEDWDGETCYAYLTDMGVYIYEPNEKIRKLCTLPSEPENFYLIDGKLTDKEIAQLYETVTYIVAYNGNVYGYNVYSGGWGLIDKEGIHWDEVSLDFSCIFHEDSFFPYRIVRSFLDEEMLLVFANVNDESVPSPYRES